MLVSTAAFATTVAVKPLHAVNVDPKSAEVLQLLVNASAGQRATLAAEGQAAEESLDVLAVGLGQDSRPPFLLRFTRQKGDGQKVEAQLELAELLEAPTVVDRLTDSVFRGVPLEENRDRHNVALVEAQPLAPRVGHTRSLGVKAAFGPPLGANASFNWVGGLAFDARFEREKYFVELGAGFLVPGPGSHKGYGGLNAEIGLDWFLTQGDTAVYLGGGVVPRLLFSEAMNSPLNVAPYAQLGLAFDRSSRMRLYADLRLAQNLMPVRVNGEAGTGVDTYPTELTLALGVGW